MDVGWDPAHQEKYPQITFTSTDITAAGVLVSEKITLNFDISAVKQA